jgi:3'(2'), 5'-bisphosphate nucleotidase
MWTIDPIDGTKGFLRGGQYAVCVSLIVDGEPVVGVIGCPNLPHKSNEPEGEKGWIFSAVRKQGAERVSFQPYSTFFHHPSHSRAVHDRRS